MTATTITPTPATPMVPTVYMTVSDMAERYVDKLRRYDCPSYCYKIQRVLQSQLVSRYGRMCINDFTIAEASAIIGHMRRVPYPNSVIYNYCTIIRACFESERRNGRLIDNPWLQVRLPQPDPSRRRVLSDREIRLLKEAFSHNALGPLFGFVMHTGLKRTEALATLAGNWDREQHRLLINAYMDYSRHTRHAKPHLVPEPHNGVSHTIPLSDEAERCLGEALRHQRLKREAAPKWDNPSGLVFTDKEGQPLTQEELSFNEQMVRTLTGIPDFNLNLLRNHFVISRLNDGVPIHLLEDYLGVRWRESVIAFVSPRSEGTARGARTLEGYFERVAQNGDGHERTAHDHTGL